MGVKLTTNCREAAEWPEERAKSIAKILTRTYKSRGETFKAIRAHVGAPGFNVIQLTDGTHSGWLMKV